jgi:hypothetical protein
MNTYSSTFQNLTGLTLGSLKVLNIARRTPSVAWSCRCITCSSSRVYEHRVLTTNPVCANVGCGRSVPPPTPSLGRTTTVATAVRASDSAAARDYAQREQQQRTVTMGQITSTAMANADPMTLSRYMDYIDSKRGKQ